MPIASRLLKRAIQLSKAGNKEDARVLLQVVTQRDPGNELAWLWYIDTLTSDMITSWDGICKSVISAARPYG